MSRTTQQTQEIINILQRLASVSVDASRTVDALQKSVNRLSLASQGDVASLAKGIKEFTSVMHRLGATDAEIRKVSSAFLQMSIDASKSLTNVKSLLSFKDIDKGKLSSSIDVTKKQIKDVYKEWGKNGDALLKQLQPYAGKGVLAPALERDIATVIELRAKLNLLFKELYGKSDIGREQGILGSGKAIALSERETSDVPRGVKSLGQANEEFLSSLGYSQQATKALAARFTDLGVAGKYVTTNILDMNTGLRHLVVEGFDKATNTVQKFSAYLDKSGTMIPSTQNRFRTFFSGVARDIVEVAKWSIAIGAVYGPLRKLNELIQESTKIQADLVDVQISLGASTSALQSVFEASLDIANQTSSAVEGVIEGYTAAVAASGSVTDSSARLATTQVLVRDSMVLSKLATLGQKESLDTLVGALRQADLSLVDGMKLLDSWVAVSRNANVSINQLATTFAIVGSGAEEVGLSFHELNALAGTMAETTKLSADEVGNAIRGIIASLQSDKAAEEFAKYGIATKTLGGDLRNMMEILRELKTLQQGGILDEKAMGALTQAGGGGARRGAQLSALVSNLSRVMEIITVSENASGDATRALELKMSTLESAIQRLNNAFSGLAQSLGMEGGIIGGLTAATEAATGMIKIVRELVSILKWAAPVIGVGGILKLFSGTATANKIMGTQLPSALARLFVQPLSAFAGNVGTGGGEIPPITGYEPRGRAPLSNALLASLQAGNMGITKNTEGATIINSFGAILARLSEIINKPFAGNLSAGSLAIPALMMASSIGREDAGERITAQAAGTGAGALATALGKSTIWPMVGSVIATAFYDTFLTFDENIAQQWMVSQQELQPAVPSEPTEEGRFTALSTDLKESLSLLETFKVNLFRVVANAGVFANEITGGKAAGIGEMSQSEALIGVRQTFTGGFDEETTRLIDEMLSQYLIVSAENNLKLTATETAQQRNIKRVVGFASQAAEDLMTKALEAISLGSQGGVQDYLKYRQAGTEYATTAGNLITAQQKTGIQAYSPQQAVSLVTGLTSEEQQILSTLVTDIVTGTSRIEELHTAMRESGTATDEQVAALARLNEQVNIAKQALPQVVDALERAAALRSIESKILPTVELPEGLTPEERQQILQRGEEMWKEVLRMSGLSESEINTWINAQKEQIITARGEVFGELTKVPGEYLSQAQQDLGLGGKGGGAGSQFGFMDLRQYDMGTFQSLIMGRYAQIMREFQRNFSQFGWQPDTETTGFILEDGFTTMDVDLKLLNLALQDLIDVNREKGLQGIYNLPQGATFMIPASAFDLDQATRNALAQGGGLQYGRDFPTGTGPVPGLQTGVGPTDLEEGLGTASVASLLRRAREMRAMGDSELETELERTIRPHRGAERDRTTTATPAAPEPEGGFSSPMGKGRSTWGEVTTPNLETLLSSLFSQIIDALTMGVPTYTPPDTSGGKQPDVQTTLNLTSDNTITLVVDGRTLATVIKPYLYSDLLRFSSSAPSTINKSVI